MPIDHKTVIVGTARKSKALLNEFKDFAFKGNVVDLAIGVIIGSAFHKLVDSLVTNLIMPLIGMLFTGKKGYLGWQFTVHGSTVHFGLFLGDVIHFLITSAALFLFVVKFLGWVIKVKKEEKAEAPLTRDQQLLTEIRDLMRPASPSNSPTA